MMQSAIIGTALQGFVNVVLKEKSLRMRTEWRNEDTHFHCVSILDLFIGTGIIVRRAQSHGAPLVNVRVVLVQGQSVECVAFR